ncbi:hypothetical protein [Amycolatopsis sp. CA-230715]|uniref:hypothetical protein n=1 Tax=Amycolatopsis sp. CA-230715 TaxID=2745196 RepID=UPI001C0100BC|nr:hypothetical protein [Amycolatopsis sp. CA-230715]QWF81730.1 hypothetical protein HUW46_05163 [Amycolatopsis sp. CA-230715]
MRTFAALVIGTLAFVSVTACTIRTTSMPESPPPPPPSSSSPAPTPPKPPQTGAADVRSNSTPKAGDCIGNDDRSVWVLACANRGAVERVTKQVGHGRSDDCITDDYTGFDFEDKSKPSLCLMLHGDEGDCYTAIDQRVATGSRVDCADPKAKVRLKKIVDGDGRDWCRDFAAGDPNAAALFYGKAPDFGGAPGAVHDVTYCLGSPKG